MSCCTPSVGLEEAFKGSPRPYCHQSIIPQHFQHNNSLYQNIAFYCARISPQPSSLHLSNRTQAFPALEYKKKCAQHSSTPTPNRKCAVVPSLDQSSTPSVRMRLSKKWSTHLPLGFVIVLVVSERLLVLLVLLAKEAIRKKGAKLKESRACVGGGEQQLLRIHRTA